MTDFEPSQAESEWEKFKATLPSQNQLNSDDYSGEETGWQDREKPTQHQYTDPKMEHVSDDPWQTPEFKNGHP